MAKKAVKKAKVTKGEAPKMKILVRSKKNKMLAGICGGIGEYFNIDPIIIRILWILFALAAGMGIIAYLVCWLLIPSEK